MPARSRLARLESAKWARLIKEANTRAE